MVVAHFILARDGTVYQYKEDGMDNRLGIDRLREWDAHRGSHSCFYDSEQNNGMAECPHSYPTLGEYLEATGFPVENLAGRFFGRDLNEPNFRSDFSGKDSSVGVSIRDRRKTHTLRSSRAASRYYEPTTDAALEERRKRAQAAAEAPSENEQAPWEVEAMEFFKERLDEIEAKLDMLVEKYINGR